MTKKTGMEFWQLCELYLDHSEAYNTPDWYGDKKSRINNKYIPKIGRKNIAEITSKDIEQIVIAIANDHTNITANRDLVVLRSIFNYAVEHNYLDKNPARFIKAFPTEKRSKYIPPVKDVLRVLNIAPQDRKDMIRLQYMLMARTNEIESLTWGAVNFKDRTVTLYTRKSKGGNLRPQIKNMTKEVYEILQRLFKSREEKAQLVIPSRITGEVRDDTHWLRKLCIKAKVKPFGTHALRHMAASDLMQEGISLKLIQQGLGHANIRTTDIYLHNLEDDKAALKVLQKKFTVHGTAERMKTKKGKKGN